MKIRNIDSEPFHELEHLSAARQHHAATRQLQFYRGVVDGLPAELDALVAAGDLQGMAGGRLLGEAVAEELRPFVKPERTGILLAGDLYSAPGADVRGASGDVRPVWRAFAAHHRWAAGVAGNHDTFGAGHDRGKSFPEAHVLDGECLELDGLRLGGVGGIIGDPRKPGRRDLREFMRAIREVLAERPQILLLHHGPDCGELRGHDGVRRALDRSGELLVICGHVYWPTPVGELHGGAQALNVDGRVVILTRPDSCPVLSPRRS